MVRVYHPSVVFRPVGVWPSLDDWRPIIEEDRRRAEQ